MLVVFCVLLSGAAVAQQPAESPDRLLQEAQQAFDAANQQAAANPEVAREQYQKAVLRYEKLLDGGIRNGKLYYNLANTYFLAGDLGRAMLNYRRALVYLPNDANLTQNISYVRKQRADRMEEPQQQRILKTVLFWHYDLPLTLRRSLGAAAWSLCFVLLGVRLFASRRALVWGAVVCGFLCIALFCSVYAENSKIRNDQSGVILAGEIVARKGNGDTYQPSFETPLHAGTEFTQLEQRTGWRRILLPDARECWIPEAAAELVRLP